MFSVQISSQPFLLKGICMKTESLFLKSLSDFPAYFLLAAPSAPEIIIHNDIAQHFLRQAGLILTEE